MFAAAAPAAAQGAPNGALLFQQRCSACHSVEAGKPGVLGPHLAGVVGRPAASTAFNYSPALKASKLTWDKTTLDAFLGGPMKLVPGTRMAISVSDPAQRAAIVRYLAGINK